MKVSDVTTEELDVRTLSDAAIDEINVFQNVMGAESHPEDPPKSDEWRRIDYRTVPEFIVPREFVARDGDGTIIGVLETHWADESTNRHVMDVTVKVHPEHRREGIGRLLLSHAVEVAEEAGKSLLIGITVDRVAGGESFARAVGAQQAMVGHTNRLVLADVDRDMVARWVSEGPGRAPGYSLVAIDGRAPDELIERMVDVLHVMNTAPTEDLDVEDQVFTVEQMRQIEEMMIASGAERRYIAAQHDASGEFVGFTEMWRNQHGLPRTVSQWGTAVRPDHRGFAIGKWLKATNVLRILNEWPEVVDIRTHNADSNDPMLGINHLLGFKPYTVDIHWQIKVEKANEYVRSS